MKAHSAPPRNPWISDPCNPRNLRISDPCNPRNLRISDSCNPRNLRISDPCNPRNLRISDPCNPRNLRIPDRGNLRILLALAALLFVALVPVAGAAPATTVTFRAKDGVPLVASWYQPSRRPAPCVILVHMLTRSREDWQVLAARLSDAGIGVLALDLRGHGASGSDPRVDPNASQDLSPDLLDVQAARAFLASRPDFGVTAVGIAGASIGANLAVLAAAADPTIRSVALLSPGLDYRNLHSEAAMKKYGDRPALLIASQEDGYATRTVRKLEKDGGGTREVRLLNGAGHGTAMLSRQPDLLSLLLEWFQRTL